MHLFGKCFDCLGKLAVPLQERFDVVGVCLGARLVRPLGRDQSGGRLGAREGWGPRSTSADATGFELAGMTQHHIPMVFVPDEKVLADPSLI